MNTATWVRETLAKAKLSTANIGLFIAVLMSFLCGCSSVLRESENFYKDRPPRRIHWREYLTD